MAEKKEHILKQTVKGTLIGTQLQTNSMFKRFYLETKNKFALVGSGLWGIIFGRGQHVTNILCVYIYIKFCHVEQFNDVQSSSIETINMKHIVSLT